MTYREAGAAELVLRDAPVYRDGRWDGDSVAVADGRIIAIGSYDEVSRLRTSRTEVESLEGRWLLPGFHDAHVHPVQAGLEMNQCDLSGAHLVEEYLQLVAEHAREHPDTTWITGGGWSMDSFPGGVPTAALLDQVCPDRPVYLPNRDHHSAWVNTRALELAEIDERTSDPHDGRIERDVDGRPTGALHEGAMGLVARLTPAPTDDDLLAALLTAQRHLHSLGVVGWQDALVGEGLGMVDTLPTYITAQVDGLLTAKVVLAQWWDRGRGLEQLPDLVERRRRAQDAGVRATSVKIMQDGVCETFTAAMLQPYLDPEGTPTSNRGLSFIDPEDLAAYVAALDAELFQVHIHALGDRAVRESLDAIARARSVNGRLGTRHHLAHLQVVDPEDVPRFAELDVAANAQPLWACRDDTMEQLTLPFLSPAARGRQYVFGSLVSAGARLACGSDWPVSSANPVLGIHVAVNRREPGAGPDTEPLLPDEALSVVGAIAGYTTGAAHVNGVEATTGRLEVGLAADMVAVDRDLVGGRADAICGARVTHTFIDGVAVFRA